jgi:carbamoyl-phosphate synthase large subunit
MSPAPQDKLNVLVLACGGSVGHGILKALALSTLRVRVLGADIAADKVGLYTVDRAFVSPWAHEPNFMDWLVSLCRAERVDAIIGGAEPIIKVLAEHQDFIRRETGAVCVVTTEESFLTGDDKLATCRWLERHGFASPAYASSEDPGAVRALAKTVGFPLIAKPRVGGGARGLVRIETARDLENLLDRPGYLFQQYVGDENSEYTVGCFCDRRGELRGTIVFRRRLQWGTTVFVEAGEFPEVREAAERITRALKPVGPCNLQFRMENGRPYCFELQVRFSGTTPVRARFGFNEVDAALRHFVLGEEAHELPRVVQGCMARYWNEMYLDPRAYAELKATGRLGDPAAYRPHAEDYGVRPCES